jgi:hypothetical protein
MIDYAHLPSAYEHDPRTPEIYRTIMSWLKHNWTGGHALAIPIYDGYGRYSPEPSDIGEPISMRKLMFYRVVNPVTLVPGVEYHGKSGTVKIWYDPNWESYFAIDALLGEETR